MGYQELFLQPKRPYHSRTILLPRQLIDCKIDLRFKKIFCGKRRKPEITDFERYVTKTGGRIIFQVFKYTRTFEKMSMKVFFIEVNTGWVEFVESLSKSSID